MTYTEYYMGDPCYVLSDKNYNALITALLAGSDTLKIYEHTIYFAYTAHGDGVYPLVDRQGNEVANLGVDAGLLSLIPTALLASPVNNSGDDRGTTNLHLGHVQEIDGIFRAEEGVFSFGDELYCNTRWLD